jgi:pyruvate,water dikinase
MWFPSAEHLPAPVSRLVAELLPIAADGWAVGARRYGLVRSTPAFGFSNRWGFYSPGPPPDPDLEALDRAAAETLAEERWNDDVRRWREDQRPAVLAASQALLAEPIEAYDDDALLDHVVRALDHAVVHMPQHFAATVWGYGALGALLHAARAWDVDPKAIILAFVGSSAATSSAEVLFDRVAAGLDEAGVPAITDLDEVRALGGDAAAALEELMGNHAWRVFHVDIVQPVLAERPAAIVAAVEAARGGRHGRTDAAGAGALEAIRARVPEGDRARFDELATHARAAYGCNDDNTVLYFSLPLGVLRRAVLEAGRRCTATGRLHAAEDAFECTRAELLDLLRGQGPSADELAAHTAERLAMAGIEPPPMLGEPFPEQPPVQLPPNVARLTEVFDVFQSVAWTKDETPDRAQASVGTEVVRGRAVVASDPTDALLRIEPGDVLVALTTTASYNTIFPVAGAVAVAEGGFLSHAAVLARELGLTAVIGLPGLLDRVRDGDVVEVDPVAGTVTVVGDE